MICMTPRAFALETIALLKPDSCHAIALAIPGGTPLAAATWAISDELTRSGVGFGAAGGTTGAGAGTGVDGVGEPVGGFSTVPASSTLFGSSPFIHASWLIEMPAFSAIDDSESPGRTV